MDMFLFHSVEFAFIIGGIKTGLEVIIHSSNIIAIINIILNLLLQLCYLWEENFILGNY